MAVKLPNFPLHIDDFLADTTHLDALEVGAYLLLLMQMWKSGHCRVPNDDRQLAQVCRVHLKTWKRLRPKLEQLLYPQGVFLSQKRLQREWNFCLTFSAKQSAKAKRGIALRRERNQILGFSRGTSRGSAAATAAPPAASEHPLEDDNNLCTSEGQAAPVDNLPAEVHPLHPKSESSDGRGAATALPTGAPPPSEGTGPRKLHHLLNTPYMRARTPKGGR